MAEGDALNDVVVNSGTSAQMIEIELYIDQTSSSTGSAPTA
jgi:NAD+ kinase